MKFKSIIPLLLATTLGTFADDKAKDSTVEEQQLIKPGHCHTILPTGEFDEPVFINEQDAEKKEVTVTIVATLTEDNYGMNFNGFAKGTAGFEVPLGWKVNVIFCNNSPVPHSLIIVEASEAKSKINLGEEPYFDGGMTPSPLKGTTSKVEKFTFTVDDTGKYAFACGFPTHSANGHWIRLDVKKDASEVRWVAPKKEEKSE